MNIPGKQYIPFKQYLRKPLVLWRKYRYLQQLREQDDQKRHFFSGKGVQKPVVINMNANDICNSKCTMCNIWQQKQGFEISPQQLEEILADDFYTRVEAVGITGGEPTLREDLPSLYEACCKKLPNLKGLSIITNAIREEDVIHRIQQVSDVCDRYHKKFSMMVSLDGYGETHDKVRGRAGNFETAVRVINHFRKTTEIPIAIGCTVSKVNVWEVDILLDFLREEGIYGRFRIAEFIKRLYNEDRGEVIRTFNEEERYHLMCFFKKVELTFERNDTYRRTYRSIINILGGGKRTIGCPYQDRGVVLNSKGELYYCAPKSKKIGDAVSTSSAEIYQDHLDERQRIIREDCEDCIHDYHAPITFQEAWDAEQRAFWQHVISLNNVPRYKHLAGLLRLRKHQFSGRQGTYKVLITGWYGTETVGDKAILGQIVHHYQQKHESVEFYISSMYPFVTRKTISELQISAHVVSTNDIAFSLACAYCDETVMGGGPLMGIDALSIPWWAFEVARKFKRKTVVFGCGIGPLTNAEHVKAVKRILRIASKINVRDEQSLSLGKQLSGRSDIVNIGDPARKYVIQQNKEIQAEKKGNTLACFLRAWTKEYQGDHDAREFEAIKESFEQNLADYIKELCAKHKLTPVFYPMHTFVVGNDDRDFNRKFAKKYFSNVEHQVHSRNTSVRLTIEAMKQSSMNLCMRFHSVLFAHTLNTDFIAIDYTNGGKIKGYLTDHQATDKMISLHDLASSDTVSSLL